MPLGFNRCVCCEPLPGVTCIQCTDGRAPDQVALTISGMANNTCNQCGSLDGSYILDLFSCGTSPPGLVYLGTVGGGICAGQCSVDYDSVQVSVLRNFVDGTATVDAIIFGSGGTIAVRWVQTYGAGSNPACLTLGASPPFSNQQTCCDGTSAIVGVSAITPP